MLKVFGCPIYYHISEGKLEPKAKERFFMGCGDGVKWSRVWSLSKRKVILSRNVVFDELFVLHSKSNDDLGKTKDVTKQVEFKNSPIRNISDQKQFEAPDAIDQDLQMHP